jgi:hypothetical protein
MGDWYVNINGEWKAVSDKTEAVRLYREANTK